MHYLHAYLYSGKCSRSLLCSTQSPFTRALFLLGPINILIFELWWWIIYVLNVYVNYAVNIHERHEEMYWILVMVLYWVQRICIYTTAFVVLLHSSYWSYIGLLFLLIGLLQFSNYTPIYIHQFSLYLLTGYHFPLLSIDACCCTLFSFQHFRFFFFFLMWKGIMMKWMMILIIFVLSKIF